MKVKTQKTQNLPAQNLPSSALEEKTETVIEVMTKLKLDYIRQKMSQ